MDHLKFIQLTTGTYRSKAGAVGHTVYALDVHGEAYRFWAEHGWRPMKEKEFKAPRDVTEGDGDPF